MQGFTRRKMPMARTDGRIHRRCLQFYNTVGIVLFLLFILVHGAETCGPGKKNVERSRKKELMFRERLPDVPENSASASGVSLERVKRGTQKFYDLVRNMNSDIIFKDDDESGDARRMTKRCSEKLEALSALVSRYWGSSVKVRVIKAYDDGHGKQRRKDPHTLHYEGRAVDIQTSDLDRRKYPKLGRLAADAGFDWVTYSSKSFVHASVKSTGTEDVKRPQCFTSTSSVQLQNGKTVLMNDLKIGDRVASLDPQGKVVYSPVIMFFHRNPNRKATFLMISALSDKKPLLITPTHLVYKLNKQTQQESAVYAKRLAVGDHIYVRNASSADSATARRITSITTSELIGVFAPLTETGTIIVDNHVVSCYAVCPSVTVSHWSMLPVRIVARFFPRFFKTDEEIPWYPRVLLQLYSSVMQWMGYL